MQLPDIWLSFGRHIHQDFLTEHPDLEVTFTELFDLYPLAEKVELHAYLAKILDGAASSERLAEIWHGSGAEIWVHPRDMRGFLTNIRKLLEASLAGSGS